MPRRKTHTGHYKGDAGPCRGDLWGVAAGARLGVGVCLQATAFGSVTVLFFWRHYNMSYVRQRTTQAGAASTALVESYRDATGRPRQRLLANLHGEPDTLHALAKLAALRDMLRKEKETLAADAVHANTFYETVTQETLHGHRYSASERKEIDGLLRKREKLLRRIAKIERTLTAIEKDGAIIKQHCTAAPDEVQTAIQTFKRKHQDAECLILGMEFQTREAKAAFRRMST